MQAPGPGRGHRNPNSLANLRPYWKKGQSGNPSGKPKAITINNKEISKAIEETYLKIKELKKEDLLNSIELKSFIIWDKALQHGDLATQLKCAEPIVTRKISSYEGAVTDSLISFEILRAVAFVRTGNVNQLHNVENTKLLSVENSTEIVDAEIAQPDQAVTNE